MAYENYQTELTLTHLYRLTGKSALSGSEQLAPNIFINSGGLDVYSSNSDVEPASKAAMSLNVGDTDIQGLNEFRIVPKYIYIEQNSGTSTKIVVSGVKVEEDLGVI